MQQSMNRRCGGWTVGSKAYWRSGQPFCVFNVDAGNALSANATGGSTVLAGVMNNNFNHHCTSYSQPCFQKQGIFNGAGPGDAGVAQTNFGNVPRNAFYGPHYSDVDINLYKDVFKRESLAFQVGAQAYNVLNHVNFGLPGNNASSSNTLAYLDGHWTANQSVRFQSAGIDRLRTDPGGAGAAGFLSDLQRKENINETKTSPHDRSGSNGSFHLTGAGPEHPGFIF